MLLFNIQEFMQKVPAINSWANYSSDVQNLVQSLSCLTHLFAILMWVLNHVWKIERWAALKLHFQICQVLAVQFEQILRARFLLLCLFFSQTFRWTLFVVNFVYFRWRRSEFWLLLLLNWLHFSQKLFSLLFLVPLVECLCYSDCLHFSILHYLNSNSFSRTQVIVWLPVEEILAKFSSQFIWIHGLKKWSYNEKNQIPQSTKNG